MHFNRGRQVAAKVLKTNNADGSSPSCSTNITRLQVALANAAVARRVPKGKKAVPCSVPAMSGITIITFTDGIAEIVTDPAVKPISADELVHIMLQAGVTAAKVTNSGAVKIANSGEIKSNPATGGPGSNAASFSMET